MSQEVQATAGIRLTGKRLDAWVLIAVFAVLLLLPAGAQVLGLASDGTAEKRTLAEFPRAMTLKQLRLFSRRAEDYVNDRFGLRQHLVRLNSLLRYSVGVSGTKDVVIGRDGWLFFTAHKLMEQHTGAERFSPAELENWVTRMEAARDWFARRGIAFYILVAPDKNSIYPEKLPGYPRPPGVPTRTDQLVARLKSSTLDFIDPRRALLDAKAEGAVVYHAGDTHWSERGAFIVYGLLMDRIRKRFPDVPAMTMDDFTLERGPALTADLAGLLALDKDLAYTSDRLKPKHPSHQTAPMKISTRPGFGWAINETKNDLDARPRLLVYGDSFTSYVLGPYFLYETFRDPVYTFHEGGTFNLRLVDEFKPNIVVMQIAERYLRLVPITPLGFDERR